MCSQRQARSPLETCFFRTGVLPLHPFLSQVSCPERHRDTLPAQKTEASVYLTETCRKKVLKTQK